MTTNLDVYPNRIHELRKAAGLTQEELGDLARMSSVHVGHLELGRRKLTMPALRSVAGALKVPPAALLSGEDNPLNSTPEGRSLALNWERLDDVGRKALTVVAESLAKELPS